MKQALVVFLVRKFLHGREINTILRNVNRAFRVSVHAKVIDFQRTLRIRIQLSEFLHKLSLRGPRPLLQQ